MSIRKPLRKFSGRRGAPRHTMRNYRTILVCIATTILCIVGASCRKDNPITPPATPGHTAIIFQVTFTSTRWCRLQWNNPASAASNKYLLVRDGRDTLFNDTVRTVDSIRVLQDSLLIPSSTYTYWLYRIVDGKHWDSATVAVHTIDTTRSGLTWEVIRLGEPNGSELHGVWASSANSVWISGAIDSTSTIGKVYEVLHYHDGMIDFHEWIGGILRGCFGTSDSNVWFAGPNVLVQWNGFALKNYVMGGDLLPNLNSTYFSAVWVTPDEKEVFASGSGGTIVHRKTDGTWEAMNSGTNLPLLSLLGFSNKDIYACGAGDVTGIVIHYDGQNWKTVIRGVPPPADSSSLVSAVTDISGISTDSVVCVGSEVYFKQGLRWRARTPTNLGKLAWMECVDARTWNQIFVGGDFGLLMGWNGDKWTLYSQFLDFNSDMFLDKVCVKDGEVFVVGSDYKGAVILHGK